jgi:hypothetical protein
MEKLHHVISAGNLKSKHVKVGFEGLTVVTEEYNLGCNTMQSSRSICRLLPNCRVIQPRISYTLKKSKLDGEF